LASFPVVEKIKGIACILSGCGIDLGRRIAGNTGKIHLLFA
jgi:hypothetical protein